MRRATPASVRAKSTAWVVVTLAMASVSAALAQTADPPPEASPADAASPRRVAIEEIVVTAQKREQNLQDVPISITAFRGEDLEAHGILDPKDLQQVTPGLVYDELAGFSIIYLRGIGTDGFLPGGDLSVGNYVDGVYFSGAHGLARELDAVERIEVLKGPQGTLFGRNSTGGAINVVTRNPTDDLTASVSATFGSFADRRIKLFVSGPLAYGFSVSASALVGRSHEYYDPSPQSVVRKFPDNEQRGARVKLRWAPSEFFDATASGLYLETEGTGSVLNKNLKPSPLGALAGIMPAAGDYEVGLDAPPFLKTRTRVPYLTVNLHPSWFDVKNIVAYQSVEDPAQFDFDGSEKPIVSFRSTDPLFDEAFTEELQVLSNKDTPLADWLEWITGFYFIKDRTGFSRLDITVLGQPQPKVRLFGKLRTESPAGFFQGTLEPLRWMDVTFGGRYQTEQRTIVGSRSELLFSDGRTMPFFTFAERTRNDSNFSPKAVLSLRPLDWLSLGFVDDFMTYVSWSRGFKSGTFNILNINQPGDEVKAETVTAFELGVKSELFGRLRANGSVFRNDVEDLQSQFISLQSGGTTNFENAGKAHVDGAEIDVTWAVVSDLACNVGATYLRGVYDDFRNASGFDPQTGVFGTTFDNTGNSIVRTPKYTLNSGLAYSLHLWKGVLEAAADVYYNDGYFFDTQNLVTQDAYYEANARLGYLYEPWNLRITAFGRNLNGAKHFVYKFLQDFGVVGKLAAPASYGVRLDWEFG